MILYKITSMNYLDAYIMGPEDVDLYALEEEWATHNQGTVHNFVRWLILVKGFTSNLDATVYQFNRG
jgi:hypothetical protein